MRMSILDIFDKTPTEIQAIMAARKERKASRKYTDGADPLQRLEDKIKAAAPQPDIMGVATMVEQVTCMTCSNTFSRPSGTVTIHFHYPSGKFAKEANTWERAPLPSNWRDLPREVKQVETTIEICHLCFLEDHT